jgi:hypothetical protein
MTATYSFSAGSLTMVEDLGAGGERTQVYAQGTPVPSGLVGKWRLTAMTLDGAPLAVTWTETVEIRPDYTARHEGDRFSATEWTESVSVLTGGSISSIFTSSSNASIVGVTWITPYTLTLTATTLTLNSPEGTQTGVQTYTRI